MTDTAGFDQLHVLRMRGGSTVEALAAILGADQQAIEARTAAFLAEGIVREIKTPRGTNYALTEQGVSRHEAAFAAMRNPDLMARIEPVYGRFLAINGEIKALCAAWQGAIGNEAARWDALDRLVGLHGRADPILADAGAIAARFARYRARLGVALDRLQAGDERFFTGLLVDSYHNIWFECHEDFLQTLGRHRAEEGSF